MFRKFNDGQELIFQDLNAIPKALLRNVYDKFVYELGQRKSSAFFGDSMKVDYIDATTVLVRKGICFVKDTGVELDVNHYKLASLESDLTVSLPPPDISTSRIDIICVKSKVESEIQDNRKVKSIDSLTVSTNLLTIQEKNTSDIIVVQGGLFGVPAAPATPDGYIKLCEITVTATTGVINANAISDKRVLFPIAGDIALNTLNYTRLSLNANSKLSDLLKEIDSILPRKTVTSSLMNNQSAAQTVDGFNVSVATKNRFTYKYSIRRKTSLVDTNCIGDLNLIYDSVNNTLTIIESSVGDDCGVEFETYNTSGSDWVVRYKTTDITGSSYEGFISFRLIESY